MKASGLAGVTLAALGLAAGAGLVAAVAGSWTRLAAEGYWRAGYYRLIAGVLATSFDRWMLPAGAIALLATAAVWRLRRGTWNGCWRTTGLVLLALVACVRLGVLVDARRAAHGPNVVLISIDTLRADRLGAYGYERPTSPVTDAELAAAGVVFEGCFSQSPKTTPAHMTMLTSLYPCVHGVALWDGMRPGPVLNPAVHTLAEVLKNAGYATGAFTGRGHVHRSRGFGQGFDVYVHRRRYEHGLAGERDGHLDRALEWMETQRHRKFLLFFHTYAVHDPYVPPASTAALFDDSAYARPLRAAVERLRGDRRAWDDAHRLFWDSVDTEDAADVAYVERLYDAAIRHVDGDLVGTLLARLDALGLARRTLVILTSDHGEAFGEHGRFLHGDLFTETLRVPLILRFPDRLPRGARVTAPVRLLDLMPTILDLVGVPAPAGVQGLSLLPLVSAGRGAPAGGAAVLSEFSGPERVYESVRTERFTYVVDRQQEQLFDRRTDPGEQQNVARDRAVEQASLRRTLEHWRTECSQLGARLGPVGDGVPPPAGTVEQLRALGYVQ